MFCFLFSVVTAFSAPAYAASTFSPQAGNTLQTNATPQTASPGALKSASHSAYLSAEHSAEHSNQAKLTLYTHGDSELAYIAADGSLSGYSIDLFQCALTTMGRDFAVIKRPLSRASSIIQSAENGIWFPSAFRGNQDRLSRSVGPAGDLQILWYQRKNSPLDPATDAFKKTAIVTTYRGSALEGRLQNENFKFKQGSADRNRLIAMVLEGRVDALLAIDFRRRLTKETRIVLDDNMKVSLYDKLPVAFQVTQPLHKSEPDFAANFSKALSNCTNTLAASGR